MLVVLAAQSWWMGRAVALLSVGLIITYLFWISARWKNDPKPILAIYLLAIAVQCVNFAEEYVTGFQRQFPKLIGYEWSDARFVTFNMAWLAVLGAGEAWCLSAGAASLSRCSLPRAGWGRVEWCRSSTFECNAG